MTVAVAHSDSAEGRAALRLAADEARLQGEELLVVSVIPDGGHLPDEAEQQQTRAAVLVELTVAEAEAPPWQLVYAPENPDRAATIVDLAVEHEASLLVIASRRRSPVGKFLLGSTVQRVVLDAPMPVFVVKAPQSL